MTEPLTEPLREWIGEQLAQAGLRAVGPVELVRSRPWSTQLTVATDVGTLWCKTNSVGSRHEAGLVEVLSRVCPAQVLAPLAVDRMRGWLLMRDGGPTVRAQLADVDLAMWESILVSAAVVQREAAALVDQLLALGVPDRRPDRLFEVRASLLADDALVMLDAPDGLSVAQRAALVARASTYLSDCEALAALGIPGSVQHDDLHDSNVFAGPPLRIFDWGDAVVGHPFGTLLVTLRVVAERVGLGFGAPELLRLRDAYLEPWTGEHDRATLVEAARLAVRVGGVGRADSYRRALLETDDAGRAEWGSGVPAWLLQSDGPTPLQPDRVRLAFSD